MEMLEEREGVEKREGGRVTLIGGRWRNPVGPNYFLSYPVCHSILLYLFYSIPYFILYAGSQAIAQNDLVINL